MSFLHKILEDDGIIGSGAPFFLWIPSSYGYTKATTTANVIGSENYLKTSGAALHGGHLWST